MNKTLKYVGLFAILPLLAVALTTDSFTDADALKSKGTSMSSYGSANAGIVCGVHLCSEYPGGREAFEKSEKMPPQTKSEEHMKKHMETYDEDEYMEYCAKYMEKHMKHMEKYGDKDRMDKHGTEHMDKHGDKDRMDKHGTEHMDKHGEYMNKHDEYMEKYGEHMDKYDKEHMEKHGEHMDKYGDKDRMDKHGEHMKYDCSKYMKEHGHHMEKHDGHMKEHDGHMEKHGDSVLRLSRANVPATIPLHMGYYEGEAVYYIITDASEQTHADVITEQQGWKVELAPLLAQAPDSALSPVYLFTNGISGDGVHGYQSQIFTSTPAQEDYSALTSHVHVTWLDEKHSRELTSESEVLQAADDGMVHLEELPVVINMPQIVWPEGQMTVVDKTLHDDTPYGGGQVLNIDTENMEVTFVAHRGWGPDGRTVYYIVTDATPSDPADMMGVVSAPSSANLIASAAAVDLYQFRNGIGGAGPLGFQPGIATSALGDENYSPMWRIFVIGWQNPDDAAVLENIGDINAYKNQGLIDIEIARPMDSDHIVNCPFIDPFQ